MHRLAAILLCSLSFVGPATAREFRAVALGKTAACLVLEPIRTGEASGLLMVQAFARQGELIQNINIQLETSPAVAVFPDATSYGIMFDFPGNAAIGGNATTDKDAEKTSFIVAPPDPQVLKLLRSENSLTLTLPSLDQFRVSLAGSAAALSQWHDCNEKLVPHTGDNAPVSEASRTSATEAGPSFDCDLARSVPERLICADPELAALDRQLSGYYEAAEARAERAAFIGDAPRSPSAWFEADSNSEWKWREENCRDKPCLLRWYAKRRAVLQWLAEAEHGFGDSGINAVQQLQNGDTIISYGMTGYNGNVIWKVSEDRHENLPDGDIEVVSEAPFTYKVLWQKGYFNGGGAFWFDTLRDSKNAIIDILRPEKAYCMARNEFFARTEFPSNVVDRVTGTEICVHT